ncbi:probable serine/threonine-protein kinase kinX isoform X2 [Oryzias latipes]|uniref:probable serine/threonine-protein kinase kinX isoform X2 n=1 Tax=Oryzias latipes TaxID=8090 RepID=UPI000CE17D4B|nr:probable serine/threonine-protein kinase kinX isoform X2 [Oryzias latipes]
MSWLQSLRDDFTLRPFEVPQTPDSAAMASGSPDLTNQEPAEVREESSGKKKSKFKTFKKFFARKKRKEPSSGGAEAGLKASQSIDNVSKTSESNALTRSEKDKGSGSKISLGGKAMSHDSVFVCDTSEANEALGASQDSIHGKVKSLQLQLKQAIRLGSPPSLMCVKKNEDAVTTSEEDGPPCSPPEYAPFHSRQDQRNSSNCLHGLDNDQLPCGASSRAVSPLVVPGDFSQPASPFACLDNSAAKHKLGLRPKANNRRKPVRRLDGKTEADTAVVEKLIISTPGAETNAEEEEEEEEQNSEDGIDDQLKPKVEEEEEEEEEEKIHAEDPRLSLFRGEEGEDESEAEADVSHGLDASCRGEQSVSEEETSDGPPVPSSESSSRASPLDPPRNTPEPPAGSRERVTPSTSSTEEDNQAESGSTSGGEAAFQEEKDGESSLLEEVLSSLKTPLKPCSLDGEDVEEVLEPKEEMEKNQKEVEEKEEEQVDIQTASPCSVLADLTTDEQRDSCQEEDDSVEEEKAAKEEEEAVNEEEEESGKEEEEALNEEEEPVKEEELLVVEHFDNHEEETKKREEEEDKNMPVSINEDDEEEEFMNLEKEDEDEKEIEEDKVQQQEGEDEGEAEMMREMISPSQDEEDQRGSPLEGADEVTKAADEEILLMQDEEDDFNHKSEHVEEEDFVGEEPEKEKAGIAVFAEQEVETTEQEVEQEAKTAEPAEQEVEQEVETSEPAEQEMEQEAETAKQEVEQEFETAEQEVEQEAETAEPAEQEVEQEMETSEPAEQEVEQEGDDVKQSEDAGLPEPLRPETQHESHSQESVISPSSKTSILSINLASPSSEKSFQFSPVAVSPGPSVTEFPTAEDEEEADTATKEVAKEEGSPPATPSPEETKVRFTIAPAWQRCQSLTSPSSSPVCVSSPKDEEVPVKDHTSEAEPASESVLGPGRVKAAGNPTSKSQTSPSPVKAPSPAAANTTESAATTGGNPNNPFGVRLRKTSTLLRFNSEEEEEAPVESVNPPTSCKAESPQVCSKPSASQPVCNKPALPKKPELQAEAGGKLKRFSGISDPPRADPPSWISVAKHKQKLYRENSLDEITLKKEEQEKKPSLPNKEPRTKAAESSSHVVKPEAVKPPVSPEKDPKRALSPQTSAASQPFKSQLLPCPVAPKPQVPPPVAKHPSPPQKSLPPPTPVPVHPKPPSIPPSKPTSTPQTTPVPSPAFASRTTPEKSPSRSAGPPGPRGLTTPALPQDEPPWMALAKKKAKAWSEMPQIVQ